MCVKVVILKISQYIRCLVSVAQSPLFTKLDRCNGGAHTQMLECKPKKKERQAQLIYKQLRERKKSRKPKRKPEKKS